MSAAMKQRNAPTLQDVAQEAGVAAMTASVVAEWSHFVYARFRNDPRSHSRSGASACITAPMESQAGLSRRRMDTIGVVAAIDGKELNLYFLEVLNGILEA